MIIIDYVKCCWKNGKCDSCSCNGGCTGCVEACPTKAIKRLKKVVIDKDKCINCGLCIKACKHKALKFDS